MLRFMKRHEKGEMELAEWMHLSAEMDGERLWKGSSSRRLRQRACCPPCWTGNGPQAAVPTDPFLASRRVETVSGTGISVAKRDARFGIWRLPCRRYGARKNGAGYHLPAGAPQYRSRRRPGADYLPDLASGQLAAEIQRFAPDLTLHVHHGVRRLRGDDFLQEAADHDIVLTTYHLAGRDGGDLSAIQWSSVVLDEAQYIKIIVRSRRRAS